MAKDMVNFLHVYILEDEENTSQLEYNCKLAQESRNGPMEGPMTNLSIDLEGPVPEKSSDDERLVVHAPKSLGLTKGMVDK